MPDRFHEERVADERISLAQSVLANELLYGKDREEKLVAAHQISDNQIRLYKREAGEITWRDEPFYPFFFLASAGLLNGFKAEVGGGFWLKELEGSSYYKYLAIFKSWKDYRAAIDYATNTKRKLSRDENSYTQDEDGDRRIEEIYSKADAVSQYLFQTGKTLFKAMTFRDLRRMQLDIETYYDKEAQQLSGIHIGREKIIIIALSDSTGWEEVLHIKAQSEREMLERLVQIIQERDPDVIEGHNIFSFDLPYLQRRCEIHGVRFAIGRDGSTPRSYPASIRFAERTIDYPYCEIAGRHVVDTLFLVQWFDMSKRAMPSYSLKECAKYFGFANETRVYIDHKDIAEAVSYTHLTLPTKA
jgi:DNA polymerase elongation subunit (family B)